MKISNILTLLAAAVINSNLVPANAAALRNIELQNIVEDVEQHSLALESNVGHNTKQVQFTAADEDESSNRMLGRKGNGNNNNNNNKNNKQKFFKKNSGNNRNKKKFKNLVRRKKKFGNGNSNGVKLPWKKNNSSSGTSTSSKDDSSSPSVAPTPDSTLLPTFTPVPTRDDSAASGKGPSIPTPTKPTGPSGFVEEGGECSKDEDCIQPDIGLIGKSSYLIFLPFEIIFSVSISTTTYLLSLLLSLKGCFVNATGYCLSDDGTFPVVFDCSATNVCDPANDEIIRQEDNRTVVNNPDCPREGESCINGLIPPESCRQPTAGTCTCLSLTRGCSTPVPTPPSIPTKPTGPSGFVEEGGECSTDEDCIQPELGVIGKSSYLIFLPFEIIFSVSISTTYLLPLLLLKNVM